MTEPVRFPITYMPQLDSLRALAALGVYAQHYLHEGNIFKTIIPLGDLGVRLFFVLSGFLITGILLNARHSIQSRSIDTKTVIWHFYLRRFLRLLPAFYIFITLNIIFNPELKQYALWFYSYLHNFHYAILGEFSFDGHVWSLAVEEQFYLLWPFIILFAPQRWLFHIMLAIVALGILSRLAFIEAGMTHFQASMLTPSHFDTLGMGGLLAIMFSHKENNLNRYYQILVVCFISGFLILAGVLATKVLNFPSTAEFIFGELGAGLLFMWVIGIASIGYKGIIGTILSSSYLIYLGKISYGMYVYHLFTPTLANYVTEKFGLMLPTSEWLQFGIFSAISILFAMISWHFLEKPILGLKHRFSYNK